MNGQLKTIVMLVAMAGIGSAMALDAEWANVDPAHHLGGRPASSGYLRGKVVMVDYRDYVTRESVGELPKMQDIWRAYKSKAFVLLGSHNGVGNSEKAKKVVKRLGLTFPVYDGAIYAPISNRVWKTGHGIYVVDAAGKVVYNGSDLHRASEVLVSALSSEANPLTVEQLKALIDFELKYLPSQALINLLKLKKNFRIDFAPYHETFLRLSKDPDVVKCAKLCESARRAKEFVPKTAGRAIAAADKAHSLVLRYEFLKKSENPLVVQEAKNALAELLWTEATLRSSFKKGDGKNGK